MVVLIKIQQTISCWKLRCSISSSDTVERKWVNDAVQSDVISNGLLGADEWMNGCMNESISDNNFLSHIFI